MTTYSLQLDHRALALQCDSDLEPQAHWLLQTLAQFDHHGKGLVDGVTVQVGWSLLSINQHHQLLAVHEPDYGTNPFANTVADVSRTLRVLTQQRDMLVHTNTTKQGAIPRFDEKIVLRKGCLFQ